MGRDLALAIHACSRLRASGQSWGKEPRLFLRAGADALQLKIGTCTTRDLSQIVYAFGQLRLRQWGTLDAIANHITSLDCDGLRIFSPQSLSNIVYGCGQLRFKHDGLLLE